MPENDNDLDRAAQLLADGEAAGAVNLLEQTTRAEPENGRAFLFLGVARSKTGDNFGGVEAMRRAAQLLPAQAAVWFNLGVALTKINEMREAQDALERAIAIDPGHEKARAALATIAPQSALITQQASFDPSHRESRYLAGPADGQVGARYIPMEAPTNINVSGQPSTARRMARGIGWGFVCAQYWTLLRMFWYFVWGGGKSGVANTVVVAIIFIFICGIVGSGAGIAIAARRSIAMKCMTVGGIAGLLIFAFEFLLFDGANLTMLFNALFWFFTGKYVGANIAKRVYAPVRLG